MAEDNTETNENPKPQKRVKELTIRFNKEVYPFQHIRIEATSNITKKDDADEVAEELEAYVCGVYQRLRANIFADKVKTDDDNLAF